MTNRVVLSIVAVLLLTGAENLLAREASVGLRSKLPLRKGWLIKSSTQVKEGGEVVSSGKFVPEKWHSTSVPSTVLNALVKNGAYPNPYPGLNNFLIPDSSDEFNKKHGLAKYSHLPDERNPWRDPYWYRTEFNLSAIGKGKHVWLNFKGINYRADVWLNGKKVADHEQMVGIYRRFRFDVTDHAKVGRNCLAVQLHPVDHPGNPGTQPDVFGRVREFRTDLMKDITFVMGIGYDCMPTVRDRNMGIWQDVYIDFTGPVDIRDPFVMTDLPLPDTAPARLTISADLVNATQSPRKGIFRGVIAEDGVKFEKDVELEPGETKRIVFAPDEFSQLVFAKPRLWWPKNYGEQNLYNLSLTFESGNTDSDEEKTTFGIREVDKELHVFKGNHGLRIYINGKKIFGQGGWLQPDAMFNMPPKRWEAEVRYLTEANLCTVTFEDMPVPSDEFLDICDRYGLMFWNSFYSSYWVRPESKCPLDTDLLAKCAADVIRRHRNHPSLILYSCVGEGVPDKDIYLTWRKIVLGLDKSRLFVPTMDVRFEVEWLKQDTPTGLDDAFAFKWAEPADYYRNVRAGGDWMFNTEVSIASIPPLASLRKFIPGLLKSSGAKPRPFPLDKTWAHHGANTYYKDYDSAIRRVYGPPRNVEDYCMKGHLVTATQHRAWSEAANHRMWDITSGVWQWKLNSC